MKLLPVGFTVGILDTVTTRPSFIYKLSDGFDAIDSSSHGVIHVNTYDLTCVFPPRFTSPLDDEVVVICSPGL